MKVDIEADNNELETQCEKVDVKVEKVNRKSRHFALAILLFIVFLIVVLGVVFVVEDDYGRFEENYDYEVNSDNSWKRNKIDLGDASFHEPISIDESYVSIDDLEQQVELSKIGDSIYLMPKRDNSVDIYENGENQLIIKIRN